MVVRYEILLSVGDVYICEYDEDYKIAWFKPESNNYKDIWQEHIIETGLLDAHSVTIAAFCSNGRLDIFVGEIGAIKRKRE